MQALTYKSSHPSLRSLLANQCTMYSMSQVGESGRGIFGLSYLLPKCIKAKLSQAQIVSSQSGITLL